MELSKNQRNQIFRAIAAGKLDPTACELDHRRSLRITHIPARSSFTAGHSWDPFTSNDYWFNMQIGTDPRSGRKYTSSSKGDKNDWDELLDKIEAWSHQVFAWADTPELWEVQNGWEYLTNQQYTEAGNTPFTPDEQETVSGQLAAIK